MYRTDDLLRYAPAACLVERAILHSACQHKVEGSERGEEQLQGEVNSETSEEEEESQDAPERQQHLQACAGMADKEDGLLNIRRRLAASEWVPHIAPPHQMQKEAWANELRNISNHDRCLHVFAIFELAGWSRQLRCQKEGLTLLAGLEVACGSEDPVDGLANPSSTKGGEGSCRKDLATPECPHPSDELCQPSKGLQPTGA